jgi:hypothetical protein
MYDCDDPQRLLFRRISNEIFANYKKPQRP